MTIQPEIRFAQQLAANQDTIREIAFQKVGLWMQEKPVDENVFTEDGMLKLWKGLFYYFWYSDKPLVQEEVADKISSYIHAFKKVKHALLYIDGFFQTMSREWSGLDRYRIEKYMMLIRQFLHQSFELMKRHNWNLKWIKGFRKVMRKTAMSPDSSSTPVSFKTHITEIYLEELADCGADKLKPKQVLYFIVPYCRLLVESSERTFIQSISENIFLYFISQEVDSKIASDFPILKFVPSTVQRLLVKCTSTKDIRRQNLSVIYGLIRKFKDFEEDADVSTVHFTDVNSGLKLGQSMVRQAAERLAQIQKKTPKKFDESDYNFEDEMSD